MFRGVPVLLSVVLLLPDSLWGKHFNSYAGPFIAYAHRIEPCPPIKSLNLSLRVSHFNPFKPYELQRLNGLLIFTEDFAGNYATRANIAIRTNNEWKEHAYDLNFPPEEGCSMIRRLVPGLHRALARIVKIPPTDKMEPCKYPKGEYKNINETVDWTLPSMPVFPYGRYRLRWEMYRSFSQKALPVVCLLIDGSFIPKP